MQQTDDIAAWLTQIWDEQADEPAPHHLGCAYAADGERAGLLPCDCGVPELWLARIAADRQILAHCMQTIPKSMGFLDDVTQARALWAISTVRILALPHADRPGYNEEWRPARLL